MATDKTTLALSATRSFRKDCNQKSRAKYSLKVGEIDPESELLIVSDDAKGERRGMP